MMVIQFDGHCIAGAATVSRGTHSASLLHKYDVVIQGLFAFTLRLGAFLSGLWLDYHDAVWVIHSCVGPLPAPMCCPGNLVIACKVNALGA